MFKMSKLKISPFSIETNILNLLQFFMRYWQIIHSEMRFDHG